MVHAYIFHNTCYDRELFREEVTCLDKNNIHYHIHKRKNNRPSNAPVTDYFKVDVSIHMNDYDRAHDLLSKIIEKHSPFIY